MREKKGREDREREERVREKKGGEGEGRGGRRRGASRKERGSEGRRQNLLTLLTITSFFGCTSRTKKSIRSCLLHNYKD